MRSSCTRPEGFTWLGLQMHEYWPGLPRPFRALSLTLHEQMSEEFSCGLVCPAKRSSTPFRSSLYAPWTALSICLTRKRVKGPLSIYCTSRDNPLMCQIQQLKIVFFCTFVILMYSCIPFQSYHTGARTRGEGGETECNV